MNDEEITVHEMSYTDEHGTYSIIRHDLSRCLTIHEVIEDFVRPTLLAAGYCETTVKDGFEQAFVNW